MTACPAGVGWTPSAAQYGGAPFRDKSSNTVCSGTKLAPACCATRRAAARRSSNSGNQRSSTAPQRSTNGSSTSRRTRGQRAPGLVEQRHVLILVLLHGAGVALRQLVPEVVHTDENAQHVRRERERIGRPAARQVGDLVAAHAAVVEPQRAVGMGRERGGGDEQGIPAAEAARQIRLAHLTIASRVGDRVALEQHREAVGRSGGSMVEASKRGGGERRRGGGDEVTTAQGGAHRTAESTLAPRRAPARRDGLGLRRAAPSAIMRAQSRP